MTIAYKENLVGRW